MPTRHQRDVSIRVGVQVGHKIAAVSARASHPPRAKVGIDAVRHARQSGKGKGVARLQPQSRRSAPTPTAHGASRGRAVEVRIAKGEGLLGGRSQHGAKLLAACTRAHCVGGAQVYEILSTLLMVARDVDRRLRLFASMYQLKFMLCSRRARA